MLQYRHRGCLVRLVRQRRSITADVKFFSAWRAGHRMYRVCLVMCSSEKALSATKAADLYLSSRFQADRLYAEHNFDCWYILSGKYGLLSPSTVIETYDMDLQRLSDAERAAWGQHVIKTLCQQVPEGEVSIEIRGEPSYYQPLRTALLAFGFVEAINSREGCIRYTRLGSLPLLSLDKQ